jgi:hypothetical protein
MKDERYANIVLGVIALTVTVLAVMMFVPPIPQDPRYHLFADTRCLLSVPNFGDVVSNAALLLAGLWGLIFLWKKSVRSPGETFIERAEWWPYMLFFVGIVLTGCGSIYYHLKPGSERLIWDRLPMTIAFMSLFSAVIAERIHTRAATVLTAPFILLGIGSVMNWAVSERLGVGDLRLYAFVQFFPLLSLPIIAYCFPARYTHQRILMEALGWYLLAKVFEAIDTPVYSLIGISGHTIKHILSGLAAYWVLRSLQKRKPVPVGQAAGTTA